MMIQQARCTYSHGGQPTDRSVLYIFQTIDQIRQIMHDVHVYIRLYALEELVRHIPPLLDFSKHLVLPCFLLISRIRSNRHPP